MSTPVTAPTRLELEDGLDFGQELGKRFRFQSWDMGHDWRLIRWSVAGEGWMGVKGGCCGWEELGFGQRGYGEWGLGGAGVMPGFTCLGRSCWRVD